jgi:hypothetical protein
VKDDSYGLRVRDNYGHPAFCLINKGTGMILKHGKHKGEQVGVILSCKKYLKVGVSSYSLVKNTSR